MATGVRINFKKPKVFFAAKIEYLSSSDALKQFKWRSDFIDILNIPFGSKQEIFTVFMPLR